MADLFMRIAMGVVGSDVVISAVQSVAKSFGGFGGIFSGMGNSLGNLAFGFRNLSTEGTIGADAVKQGITGLAGGFLSLGAIAGTVVAGIAVGVGVVAVKAAGDFQASMTRLVTSAGELPQNLKAVSDGILQMSVDTGTSTQQLGAGMYYAESAGYNLAHGGLDVLRAAAQGAKSENAGLDTVCKALTTTMVDYHMSSTQSASAMNGLIAAVQNGKTNLQDLASSMGAVLPIASSLGISFPQVAGALDTMTNAGMPAQQAAQNLAHVLVALSAPSNVATKSMLAVGLTAQQVKDTLANQGLPAALQLIEDHVGKKFPAGSVAGETALKNIMGGLVGLKLSAQLTGPALGETKSNIDKVAAAMGAGGKSVMGFTDIQNTFNFKVEQAKEALNAFLIKLGTQLMPVFTQLMNVLFPIIAGFLNWITNSNIIVTIIQTLVNVITTLVAVGTTLTNFFKNNEVAMAALKATLILLAVVVGTVMVIALVAWTIAAWNAAAANIAAFWPVYLVILIIIVIITIVILAIQHWGQIVQFVGGIFSWLGTVAHTVVTAIGAWFSWLGTQVHAIWTAIASFLIGVFAPVGAFFVRVWQVIWNSLVAVWNAIKTIALVIFALIVFIIIKPFVPLIDWFKAHWTQIQTTLVAGWNAIKGAAIAVWGAITGALSTAWNAIVSVATAVWGKITSAFMVIWTPIASAWSAGWAVISNVLSTVWNAIAGVASTAWNTVSTTIMDLVNTLWTNLTGVWNNIKNDFTTAMNSLAGIASSAWNAVSGAIKSAIDGMIGIINNMINGVNNVTGKIGVPAIPTIPLLAQGGSNLPAGPYIVGDAGPELLYLPGGSSVVPMSSSGAGAGRAGGGAGGSTYNIYISLSTMARSQSEVNNLVDLLEQELARRLRVQTSGWAAGGIF